MNLHLIENHRSITIFPDIDLPDFTLVTGLNGSGKTHFLEAVQKGSIRCDDIHAQTSIRLFNWTNLLPTDGSHFQSQTILSERQELWNVISSFPIEKKDILFKLSNFLRNHPALKDYASRPFQFLHEFRSKILPIDIGPPEEKFIENEERLIAHALNSMLGPRTLGAKRIADYLKKPIYCLTESDINSSVPNWGHSEIFQISLGRLYVSYRDLLLQNKLSRLDASDGEDVKFMESEEFVAAYGPAPWDFVDKIIENAGFDFVVTRPDFNSYSAFVPRIQKKKQRRNILF